MREAPWVLSDVLRAKNGVEGKKRERSRRWLRGEDAKKRRGKGREREKERKEPVCSPPVHILEPPGPRPTDEANPRDWWRVVG